ncbi:hypothetical protein PQC39_gp049 [Vibrio phage Vp_R1]|uniref:Uncharacterized protein n=1 Tax=Vibrio phage Vp_R1 TaxID=2059867 RepID=A0A2H5BQ00_9CAUD|nr:hypothetical protein PQC39_gp049 [Vibrio phage Vp_R1]AUG88413.1 hypothetical protein VPR_049 [Vibrio phage Vp_R1]
MKLFIISYHDVDVVEILSIISQNGLEVDVVLEEVGNPFGTPRLEVGSIVASGYEAIIDLLETVS